jgi:hypothetical protein
MKKYLAIILLFLSLTSHSEERALYASETGQVFQLSASAIDIDMGQFMDMLSVAYSAKCKKDFYVDDVIRMIKSEPFKTVFNDYKIFKTLGPNDSDDVMRLKINKKISTLKALQDIRCN